MNTNLKKFYRILLDMLPLLILGGTILMWVDVRYMHRYISDTRFIELQRIIVQSQVRDFHQMIKSGVELTPEQELQFELDKDQLKFLMSERNRLLGIGESQ